MPRIVCFLATLYAVLCLCALAPAQEQDQAVHAAVQKSLTDLDLIGREFSSLDALMPGTVRQTRLDRQDIEKKFSQIALVAELSSHNPYELRAAQVAVDKLASLAKNKFAPLGALNEGSDKTLRRIGAIERDFTRMSADNQDPDLTPVLAYYLKYLAGMRAQCERTIKFVDAELKPTAALSADITGLQSRIGSQMPEVWREFYLTPSSGVLSLSAWRLTGAQLKNRLRNLAAIQSLIGGGEAGQLADIAIKTILLPILLTALWLATRGRRPRLFALGDQKALRGAVLKLTLGMVLAYAATSAPLLLYDLLSVIAEILIAMGVASLCWQGLRPHDGPAGKNPLFAPTALFALALIIHVLDPPAPFDAVTFAVACLILARRREAAPRLPSPLQSVPGTLRLVCLALALACLAGWQNLAMLVYAGAYLLILAACAGLILTRRLRDYESTLGVRPGSGAKLWLTHALGYPAIYLGLFLAALYWFCARIGGREVFAGLLVRQTEAGAVSFSLWRLFVLLTGFFVARSSVAAADSLADKLASNGEAPDKGLADMIRAGATYVIWGAYALIALTLLGVDMASLAVVLGGLSVGIGFGLQNVVNNFVAGLILLFGRSIQSGDVIQLGEITGTVKKVNVRNTIVQTGDNATLFVPNSELIGKQLLNWTHKDPRLKKEVVVRAAYGADAELIRRIMLEAAAAQKHALADPAPKVFFQNFGETALEFSLAVWIDSIANARRTLSAIRDEIYRKGEENGIRWTHT